MVNKFYFGNVAYTITEDQLFNKFSEAGEVSSIKLCNDKETGKFKGFGFVEMSSGVQEILALHGTDFNGRPLVVRAYEENKKAPSKPQRKPFRGPVTTSAPAEVDGNREDWKPRSDRQSHRRNDRERIFH